MTESLSEQEKLGEGDVNPTRRDGQREGRVMPTDPAVPSPPDARTETRGLVVCDEKEMTDAEAEAFWFLLTKHHILGDYFNCDEVIAALESP